MAMVTARTTFTQANAFDRVWPAREALLVTVVRDKGNKAPMLLLTVTTRLGCDHGSQSPRASSTHQVS